MAGSKLENEGLGLGLGTNRVAGGQLVPSTTDTPSGNGGAMGDWGEAKRN